MLTTSEFIEEQISNWKYTNGQCAKEDIAAKRPGKWNPYNALPQMRLLTYQMPEELLVVASAGEFDEFDFNEIFPATSTETGASFKQKDDVQKWLHIIRRQYAPRAVGSESSPYLALNLDTDPRSPKEIDPRHVCLGIFGCQR